MLDEMEKYLKLIHNRPDLFETTGNGIRVITESDKIDRIVEAVSGRYVSQNYPPEWADVGVLYEDPYLRMLRDAVIFPDGRKGVYHRIIHKSDNPSGVAVLCTMDGKILLLRHFRHATRERHLEIPRGAIELNQTPEQAVYAEISEEAGGKVRDLVLLGPLHPTTTLVSSSVLLFFATLTEVEEPAYGDGIEAIRWVEAGELENLITNSEVTDSFTIGAFMHARLKGLI